MGGRQTGAVDSTRSLLDHIRRGGNDARRGLVARYRGPLCRWARTRFSNECEPAEIDRLVRATLDEVIEQSARLPPSDRAAFHWRLREAIEDRVKRATPPGSTPSRIAGVVGEADLKRYETALRQLDDLEKDVVIARIELGFSRDQMAALFGESDVEAIEATTRSALLKLAWLIGNDAATANRDS